MTDDELIKMAAKAAGVGAVDVTGRPCVLVINDNGVQQRVWRPLDDDGDALRLAVALNLVVNRGIASTARSKVFITELDAAHFEPYAATRRAIVRAAAELGRGK